MGGITGKLRAYDYHLILKLYACNWSWKWAPTSCHNFISDSKYNDNNDTLTYTLMYSVDGHGIHHIIPPAPLECEEGGKAYGFIEIKANEMELNWTGSPPKKTAMEWPKRIQIREAGKH